MGALCATGLALAAAGYAVTGSPGHAIHAPAPAVAATETDTLVERLEQHLREAPADAAGWALLARAYVALERFDAAGPACSRALAASSANADLLADCADALAAQNAGALDAEAATLVQRALALNPDHPRALALSGSMAFDRRDYDTAVRLWERVERTLPADSRFLPQLSASIARARALAETRP